MQMEKAVLLEYLIEFTLIYFITLQGSIAKEYLRILKTGKGKVSWGKVLLSSLTGSIITFSFAEKILLYVPVRGIMFVSFMMGLIGFQLLEKISTVDDLKSFVKYLLFKD